MNWNMFSIRAVTAVTLSLLLALGPGVTAADDLLVEELAELSLEELMTIEVYSVGKKAQKASEAAAAIYVLSNEDIHRSGATTIPELLRLVPGMEVGRIDSNAWGVSARGFNDRFANKLLVLVDGRSVYNPLFAGIYWEVQDTLFEDIDRVEVIRGPGGTLWGANAVNGVINIITKSAKDSHGVILSGGGGPDEGVFGHARVGLELAPDLDGRAYAKWFDRRSFETPSGSDGPDKWDNFQTGFRGDWNVDEDTTATFQGDFYSGDRNSRVTDPSLTPISDGNGGTVYERTLDKRIQVSGLNVLARWRRQHDEGSETEVQAYYDRMNRSDGGIDEERDILDLTFQSRRMFLDSHDVIWGLGYRLASDELLGDFVTFWDPMKRTDHLFNAFVQDEMFFFDDELRVTVGAKVEHNDYSGVELQPNIRALWKPDDDHVFWGAISRAVRSPSRSEDDVALTNLVLGPGAGPLFGFDDGGRPTVVRFFGQRGFDSEKLLSYELGYRTAVGEHLSIDLAGFYNDYRDLRTIISLDSPSEVECLSDQCIVRFGASNETTATTHGGELAVDWIAAKNWRLRMGYSYVDIDVNPVAGDPITEAQEGASPNHQAFVRSLWTVTEGLDFDVTARWVDGLPSVGIDDYVSVDARLAWQPRDDLELAIVGQNLVDPSHREFATTAFTIQEATGVPRSVYGQFTWKY